MNTYENSLFFMKQGVYFGSLTLSALPYRSGIGIYHEPLGIYTRGTDILAGQRFPAAAVKMLVIAAVKAL